MFFMKKKPAISAATYMKLFEDAHAKYEKHFTAYLNSKDQEERNREYRIANEYLDIAWGFWYDAKEVA